MHLQLTADSRVCIDLRATGLLRAVGHDPTLVAVAGPCALDVSEAGALEVPLFVSFRVDRIEPPLGLGASDRDKMRENLEGADVLDAKRFPTLDVRGKFVGSTEQGRVDGELVVRGVPRRLSFDVQIVRDSGRFVVNGSWDGRLTDLGIKPFRALLGALRLDDFIRLRLEAAFTERDALPSR